MMTSVTKRISTVLIDLSGTLHIEDTLIPGSVEALQRLKNAKNFKIKFVTNTTKESKTTLLNRLIKLGFTIEENEIFTCLTAARHLIEKKGLRPFYFLSEDALNDFRGIPTNDPNAVVVGLSPDSFHYENMTTALRLLLDGGSLIAIHKSRYYKRKDGLAIGPGAYVSALEYATGKEAIVVGKPEASFFLTAIESIGGSAEQTVMIGDDARDDVQGAMKAGLKGCLVKTGKYRVNDENLFDPPPTFVAENFADAVDIILKHNSSN